MNVPINSPIAASNSYGLKANMQNVFITGASSGIGAALALQYAQQGACLGLVARRTEVLEALRKSLPNPERHFVYALDVTDHAALEQAAHSFNRSTGGAHIVIANAGISRGTLTEFSEDLPVFEKIVATNLVATAVTFAPFIEGMKKLNVPCRLVGIGSVAGIRGLPGAEAYCASKAAVISYCESLRLEMHGTQIRVVTICPGYIDTPMTQVNRYAMPFLMPVEKFARQAHRAIERGDSYRVIPWQMGWVTRLLRILPNSLYDLAMVKAPRKQRGHE
jgi:NAD(P)-dependent dehydrogenase (short-subunit alcohol dehydrogenase family)